MGRKARAWARRALSLTPRSRLNSAVTLGVVGGRGLDSIGTRPRTQMAGAKETADYSSSESGASSASSTRICILRASPARIVMGPWPSSQTSQKRAYPLGVATTGTACPRKRGHTWQCGMPNASLLTLRATPASKSAPPDATLSLGGPIHIRLVATFCRRLARPHGRAPRHALIRSKLSRDGWPHGAQDRTL